MKRAALYSILLHIVILIVLYIGFYNPFHRMALNTQPIMIEVATIKDISTAPKLSPESNEQPKPQPTKPEKVEPKPEPVKPEPPQPQKPEPKPEPTKPEPVKPAPEVKEEPAPIPKPKAPEKKPEPPKEKKQEQKKPPKAEVNLTKKKTNESKDKDAKKKPEPSFEDILESESKDSTETPKKTTGAPASKVDQVMSTSDLDALRRQIYKCWIVPAGARGAKELIVDVDLEIGKDGTVLKANLADKARAARDEAYRAAAESAVRAVLDPKCNPLPLPPNKYDQWKSMTFSFNPKDMF